MIRLARGRPSISRATRPRPCRGRVVSVPSAPEGARVTPHVPDDLTDLISFSLTNGPVGDEALACIRRMPRLKRLYLMRTEVGDATLARVADLPEIEELYLSGTRVTDAGLAHLRGKQSLRKLMLNDFPLTDAGLAHLSGLTELRLLKTKVTPAGLAGLQKALPGVMIVGP